ncbi:CK1 protein kinase [Loa loa]|uniref:non-specific serine/threonine protein kinase n=1 Tax=Loa loa TaxID=7209 RepID=A0A1S0UGL7_LOALO|nr:CK1 protein kinase [Loa loa]EJD74725.1 CK1 protein kinase [Loa loa]
MASAYDQSAMPDNLNGTKDLLSANEIVADRFIVEEKIGQGSFGQIYRGKDKRQKRMVAIKVEPEYQGELNDAPNDPRRLVIEQQPNIPIIYASGKTEKNYPYIVMQILGKNLTTLRKERTEPKFTLSTAFRIGEQVAHALQYLHEAGYIHRDVKPSNCCIGVIPETAIIYLVDFGMCRKVIDSNGKWHMPRFKSIFKGTLRYASLNAIVTHQCGPCDDMMGLIYSIIELALSKLPWARSAPRDMIKQKATITGEELCAQLPLPFLQCHNYIQSLKPTEMPRHNFINECLKQCIPLNVQPTDPYDWEIIDFT